MVSAAAAQPAAAMRGVVTAPGAGGRSYTRRSSYRGRIGEAFTVRDPAATLVLVAVEDAVGTDTRGRSLAGRDDAFLLILDQQGGAELGQGTYLLRHPDFNAGELLLVPTDRSGRYVAVVNATERVRYTRRRAVTVKRRRRAPGRSR